MKPAIDQNESRQRRLMAKKRHLAAMLILVFVELCVAQNTLTLVPSAPTVNPGQQLKFRVVHFSTVPQITALQWSVRVFPPLANTLELGPAGISAQKMIRQNLDLVLLFGLNSYGIPAGDVGTYTIPIPITQPAGPITVTLYDALGVDAAGIPRPVTMGSAVNVLVTLPAQTPPPIVDVIMLSATPMLVPSGGNVTLTWSAPTALRSTTDWVGLYLVTGTNREYRWYSFTRGTGTGSVVVPGRRTPGTYEFRYLTKNSYTSVANSAPITFQ